MSWSVNFCDICRSLVKRRMTPTGLRTGPSRHQVDVRMSKGLFGRNDQIIYAWFSKLKRFNRHAPGTNLGIADHDADFQAGVVANDFLEHKFQIEIRLLEHQD
jgi:hypothetical protein